MIETQGISKSFGKIVALTDVDFSVEQGEIFGIAGPNGAGKSTLFNIITGIYPPSAGKVLFQGHDITRLRPHQITLRGIGRTYQIPAAFHTMSVFDNIRIGTIFGSRGKKQVGDILEFLNLSPYAYRLASNLDLYTTKLVMLG